MLLTCSLGIACETSRSKHGRPIDLKTALRQSVGEIEKRPPAPRCTVVTLRGRLTRANEDRDGGRIRGLDIKAGAARNHRLPPARLLRFFEASSRPACRRTDRAIWGQAEPNSRWEKNSWGV
jgi:hypothetical protein